MIRKIVIIEDEAIAAQNLVRLLAETAPQWQIVATLQGVEDSLEWFQQNPSPDVVFTDIHLADGLAFNIFNNVKMECPVVFTTAYDQYALQAFQANGIDYLLKPISKDALLKSVEKIERFSVNNSTTENYVSQLDAMVKLMTQQSHVYKSFFLIPWKDRLIPLAVSDIAYLFVNDGVTRAVTFNEQNYVLDEPLELLMKQLDPDQFFRANRQYIVSKKAVRDIVMWFGSKLRLTLSVPTPEQIVVCKANVTDFKAWFTK